MPMKLIVLLSAISVAVLAQEYSNSPCPNVFESIYDGSEWYGNIEIPSPQFGTCVKLKLTMILDKKINTTSTGKIELLGSREKVLQQVINGRSLSYKVHYPVSTAVPHIESISFNDQLICRSNNDNIKHVTSISLKHIFLIGDGNSPEAYECYRNENVYPVKENSTEIQNQGSQNNQYPSLSSFYSFCGAYYQRNTLKLGETQREDWPWLVAIFHKQTRGVDFICSGTLITNKHVITAANCFSEKKNQPLKINDILVKSGVYNVQDWVDPNMVISSLTNFHIFPEYDDGFGIRDNLAIAVMKPINFNKYIQPICVSSNSYTGNHIDLTVGWGVNKRHQVASMIPQQATVKIVSTCGIYFPYISQFLSNKMLCSDDSDISNAYSHGSSLYAISEVTKRWVMRGVLGFHLYNSTSKGVKNHILYANVPYYIPWIEKVIKYGN